MLKSLTLGAILVVLTGCGSSPPPPTPTPKPASPTPTTVPSGFVPSGSIEFGSAVSGTRVQSITSSFAKNKRVAWVAHFSERPGTKSLTWTVTRTGGQGRHPAVVATASVSVPPDSTYLASRLTPQQLKSKGITFNGNYAMQYSRGTKVLAVGDFALLPGSGRAPGY
jgi:hypothetical protein